MSRISNLFVLPGLERNLRILIDWLLDIPFRADIAVLAPEPTEPLTTAHFEPGDEVIRQDDHGETAYVVESGQLEIIRDGQHIGELGPGDLFGEIALVTDRKRTATIRAISPCQLTAITHDRFQALTVGSGTLASVIRKQMEQRLESAVLRV